MSITIRKRITELKQLLGDFKAADEDFYESEEVAEFDPDKMFQYFRNELDEHEQETVLRLAGESKLFLEDLIGVGKIILADQANMVAASKSSRWQELCSLPLVDSSKRNIILSTNPAFQIDLAPMAMLAADSGGVDIEAKLSFDATVNAYEDGELVIKVSSEDPSLHCTLVGYCISGEDKDQIGYLLLRKGVLGKVSGMVRIDRSALSGSYRANFERVDYSDLSNTDVQSLEAAIGQDSEDNRSQEAWKQWIKLGLESDDGQGLSKLLNQLNSKV